MRPSQRPPWIGTLAALLIALTLLLFCAGQEAHASGPRWVAGSSYFNPSVMGSPIVWAGGQVTYYTDLNALSPQVTQAQANKMVAAAAAIWNNVNTAAVLIQNGGNLAENVDASITNGANGIILPSDLLPTATTRPVGIVYDQTGAVIDGIYGTGTSAPATCQTNAVFVIVDNFAVTGNIAHALILVNGLCATTTPQITMLQYQLIRAFGRVLGLDWSQTNEEMFVGAQITAGGLQGWPVMHPIERLCSATTGQCMPNPTQLRPDDIASLNRLYPVTSGDIGSFPGKTLTAAATISVQGTIQFPGGQGMQGVNVVLRPLTNGVPDIRYTVTAVSGDYFQGNAGNPVTGSTDAAGNLLTRFGSNDSSLGGFFDLSDVPLPPGVSTADYQLSFEPINPLYTGNVSVGPYSTGQVTPSGTMPVITLTGLSAGASITQNVVIEDAADESDSGPDGPESAPAQVPASGEWTGRVVGYGHSGWFQWWALGGREFTVEAQALDANGAATENKVQLVLGAWNGTDAGSAPPVTGTVQPFNGSEPGLTTLPVLTIADSEVRIGLADWRGDGRPDYAYHARVLYAGSVTPARLPASGGQIVIQGMGFRPGMTVTVNGQPARVESVTPNAIVAIAPASGGVTGDALVQIQDPQTLGAAAIGDGLSYGSGDNDALSLVTAPMGTVPLGITEPLTVRVINVTNQQPVAGDTVLFSLTEGAAAMACGQPTCTLITAGDGTASLPITANSTSLAQITVSLANGSTVLDEFTGNGLLSVSALTPSLYIAFGATAQWPVEAVVLSSSGAPLSGQNLAWSSTTGVTLSESQNMSSSAGTAANQIAAGPFTASIASTATACLSGTTLCATFTVVPVHPETAVLAPWSGTSQQVLAGQAFLPVVLRVMDADGHPLVGASVTFSEALYGWTSPCAPEGPCPPAPLLLRSTATTTSALDGSVTLVPLSTSGLPGRLFISATTGNSVLNLELDASP